MELDLEEVNRRNHQIRDLFFANSSLNEVRFLHSFLPVISRKEVNTWLIIDEIWKRYPSVTVVVPVCDFVSGSLRSCSLFPDTVIHKNKWGIPEPEQENILSAGEIDVVLAPLLVADRQGNRVGYGKGFYDRFFGKCRKDVRKIGLSMFEPVDIISDVEVTDIALDMLVTPDNCYFFNQKQNGSFLNTNVS